MNYRDLIEDALAGHGADYCEIRIEESDSTRLTYHGRELEDIAQTSGRGGNVRAVVNGGWGFASFNDLSNLKEQVGSAVEEARLVGGDGTKLAGIEPVVDIVPPVIVNAAAKVSLDEKKRQMDHYNDLIWSVTGILSSDIIYGDSRRRVCFGSSEGSYIEQEFNHVVSRISAQAKKGGDVQQAGFSLGSLGDYKLVTGLDEQVIDAAKRAVALLSAKALTGGERTVILDPVLAGVFVHEAFGHLSESDNVSENDKLRDLMYMGRKFGGKHLNFTDGAAIPGLRGSYKYDDEGTLTTRTPLV
ncbi:MAG: TldD/PmbA family protein, partial [Chloroflexi bacterium]|nr:TldD/PmbA family protein [Chloroflexota bacterium]